MDKKIVGVFTAEPDASRAIEELKRHGFRSDDISVITKNKKDSNSIHEDTGTKAPEGMASGATTGGLLGGLTGLLVGIGALAIPGIGPIIAAGPIAATLAGVAVGVGTGGLVGGLVGLGIPEDEAESYDRYVGQGHILVMVEAKGEHEQDVYRIFKQYHSLNGDRFEGKSDNAAGGEGDRNVQVEVAAGNSVKNTVEASFNGSGLEDRKDDGLGIAPEPELTGDRAEHDIHRPGMTGAVEETDD